jgi:hypothetical protein
MAIVFFASENSAGVCVLDACGVEGASAFVTLSMAEGDMMLGSCEMNRTTIEVY